MVSGALSVVIVGGGREQNSRQLFSSHYPTPLSTQDVNWPGGLYVKISLQTSASRNLGIIILSCPFNFYCGGGSYEFHLSFLFSVLHAVLLIKWDQ